MRDKLERVIKVEKEIWKGLIYNGVDMGESVEVSSRGAVRNKKLKNSINTKWEGRYLYSLFYFNGRTRRIKVGQAQEESGLERTVFDKELIIKTKPVISERQERVLLQLVEVRLKEEQQQLRKIMDKEWTSFTDKQLRVMKEVITEQVLLILPVWREGIKKQE